MENDGNYINAKRYPWVKIIAWSFMVDCIICGMFFFRTSSDYIDFSISYYLIRCSPVFLLGLVASFTRKKSLTSLQYPFIIAVIATFLMALIFLIDMYIHGAKSTDGFVPLVAFLFSVLIIFLPFISGYVFGLILNVLMRKNMLEY